MNLREPSLKAATLSSLVFVLVAACKGDDGGGGNDETGSTGGVDSTGGVETTATTSTTNGSMTSQTSMDTSSTNPTGVDTTGEESTGGNSEVQAFRFTSIAIRDPHFFPDVTLFGCTDVTDEAPLGMPGINDQFNEAISTDDPMMPDMLLDLSLLLIFRPLDQADGASGDMDFANGACNIPADNTVCDLKMGTALEPTTYSSMAAGTCLEPDAANLSSQNYQPGPGSTTGPCFVAGPTNVTIVTSFDLPLENAMVAGQFVGDPADSFMQGSLQGTLTEAVADTTLLPMDIQDQTGAMYISELLPGGTGNCAMHDDRDGAGWVFHVDFTAELVPWNGD